MKDNVIGILNSPLTIYHIFEMLGAVAVWVALWYLLLKRLLKRRKVTSFWYGLYELGALGTLGLVVFLALIVILFIASIQAILSYGTSLLFPLILFWGGIVAIAILIIRYIHKKKGR